MKYFFTVFFLLFSACSIKNYEHTEAKIVIIKSPQLRFADLGYIRHTQDAVELELFVAGKSVQKIEINHFICVKEGCLSKSSFNSSYLSSHYPDTLLQNILLAKPIFQSQNLQRIQNGFTQSIQTEYVDIIYRVDADMTYFKDKKNKILIKIKETK